MISHKEHKGKYEDYCKPCEKLCAFVVKNKTECSLKI